jgi:signal transduction histidine kinase
MAEAAAPTQLLAASVMAALALGVALTATWQALADAGSDGPGPAQLAIMIAVGAVAALIALRPGDPAPTGVRPCGSDPVAIPQESRVREITARLAGCALGSDPQGLTPTEPSQLLAQMHHELRTPLNAVIGFSEVMMRELHGPLGNARYHEYAAHISESGGRLLKASEDALAVAATMSALVADRRALHRERLPAAVLLQGAYAAPGVSPRGVCLQAESCRGVQIECDGQTTSLALQHVLAEAAAHTPTGGAIIAGVRRVYGQWHIEIAAEATPPGQDAQPADGHDPRVDNVASSGVRLILARSLLEMQGAALTLSGNPRAGTWSARIAFPDAAGGRTADLGEGLNVRARRTASRARRADCVGAAAAAARASAGSRSAPPA